MLKSLIKLSSYIKNVDREAANYLERVIHKIAGKVDDLKAEFPQFSNELEQAVRDNIKPAHLKWVVDQLNAQEPISEIINIIKEFENKRQKLQKKDLYQYKSLGEIRGELEALGESRNQLKRKQKDALSGQFEVIYDSPHFHVIHPHSKEASCYFGKGTRWCVSATQSKNYFNEYARDNVFLYMILSKNPPQAKPEEEYKISDEEDDRNDRLLNLDKIAYAYIKGENGQTKAQIFDSRDSLIHEEGRVEQYINFTGDDFDLIKSKIEQHVSKQEKTKIHEMIARLTPDEFLGQLKALNTRTEKGHLLFAMAGNSSTPPEVLKTIFEIVKAGQEVYDDGEYDLQLAKNPNTPPEVIDILIDSLKYEDEVLKNLMLNPNIQDHQLLKIAEKGFYRDLLKRENLSDNIIYGLFNMALDLSGEEAIKNDYLILELSHYLETKGIPPAIEELLLSRPDIIKHLERLILSPNISTRLFSKLLELSLTDMNQVKYLVSALLKQGPEFAELTLDFLKSQSDNLKYLINFVAPTTVKKLPEEIQEFLKNYEYHGSDPNGPEVSKLIRDFSS